jgi:hypothetical protein
MANILSQKNKYPTADRLLNIVAFGEMVHKSGYECCIPLEYWSPLEGTTLWVYTYQRGRKDIVGEQGAGVLRTKWYRGQRTFMYQRGRDGIVGVLEAGMAGISRTLCIVV